MIRRLAMLALLALLPVSARAFTVSGRFLYEDRMWNGSGYTGLVQNLPIRHARVDVVNAVTQQSLASGATDAAGFYSVQVTGQIAPVSLYVRCSTDGATAGYFVRVVDNFVRVPTVGLELTASQTYAIRTDTTLAHDPTQPLAAGTYLIQDPDGTGVAQAFNIFDNGIDFFDWVATVAGGLPSASQFLVYAWGPAGSAGNPTGGSNYSQQGVYIGAAANEDTDGWSDTVVLHETGHWFDDIYSQTDNPGGAHFIGDNDANVLLAYGEGSATYHCAKVRELRATTRQNLVGQPVDAHVSIYGDLLLPPPVGTPGGLSFSYDFETGNFADTGAPIGQIGSANETNVTSALWDLVDGPSTPDETPGVDDDPVAASDAVAFDIEHAYLRPLPPSAAITVEDYFQGWFARNGAQFQRAGLEAIFAGLAKMPFVADAFEPDNAPQNARAITPLAVGTTGTHPVINELDPGPRDAVEILNPTPGSVDLTGWQIEVYVNGTTNDATRVYTFPPFTLGPGEVVAVHEGGDVTLNGRTHLYGGSAQGNNAFNISWNQGLDGACVLRRPDGTAVDFVKWRDANGVDNTTPVPAGLAYSGALDTGPAPNTMQRDLAGTDTDTANDFHSAAGLVGSPNHPAPEHHTVFDVGDQDVFAFQAVAGTRYGFETRGPYSASDTRIELLGPDGGVLGANDDLDPGIRDSRVDFFASNAGTYFLRVTHVGANTDYADYDLLAFVRRAGASLQAPTSISADARNQADTADEVRLQWLDAGAYDSVAVYRDSVRIAVLPGAPSSLTDHADRGLHRWEVSGFSGGQETARAGVREFAGIVTCFAFQGFEGGNSDLWLKDGTTWGATPTHAKSGQFSFTDSPAGTYMGAPLGGNHEAIATLALPVLLPPGSGLDFDHICITEGGFDFGIVEISTNNGGTWKELGRWSESSYPEWGDHVAGPTDWKHESLDLSAYASEKVLLRLRLESDSNLEFDGWYVDNFAVNDSTCSPIDVGVGPAVAGRLEFLPPSPNPARGPVRMTFALPAPEVRVDLAIYDVAGRVVRFERLGPLAAGAHSWTWDGRDRAGLRVASGAYFARLDTGARTLTQKLLKLAP